jgi:hypothetical protein
VFVTTSKCPDQPVAAFQYADMATDWARQNYPGRSEVRTMGAPVCSIGPDHAGLVPEELKCSRCGHRAVAYAGPAGDGRPAFRCLGCGNWWTYGGDGGPWGEYFRGKGVSVCAGALVGGAAGCPPKSAGVHASPIDYPYSVYIAYCEPVEGGYGRRDNMSLEEMRRVDAAIRKCAEIFGWSKPAGGG